MGAAQNQKLCARDVGRAFLIQDMSCLARTQGKSAGRRVRKSWEAKKRLAKNRSAKKRLAENRLAKKRSAKRRLTEIRFAKKRSGKKRPAMRRSAQRRAVPAPWDYAGFPRGPGWGARQKPACGNWRLAAGACRGWQHVEDGRPDR